MFPQSLLGNRLKMKKLSAIWKRVIIPFVVLAIVAAFAGNSSQAHEIQVGYYNSYRLSQLLEAGRRYIIETNNLRKRDLLQPMNPATRLRILDLQRKVVLAENEGYDATLRSRVEFTPTENKEYMILVSDSESDYRSHCGYGDLVITDVRTGFKLTKANISFCSVIRYAYWRKGECFETNKVSGDPYLFLFPPSGWTYRLPVFYLDDDGGPGLNSKICPEG